MWILVFKSSQPYLGGKKAFGSIYNWSYVLAWDGCNRLERSSAAPPHHSRSVSGPLYTQSSTMKLELFGNENQPLQKPLHISLARNIVRFAEPSGRIPPVPFLLTSNRVASRFDTIGPGYPGISVDGWPCGRDMPWCSVVGWQRTMPSFVLSRPAPTSATQLLAVQLNNYPPPCPFVSSGQASTFRKRFNLNRCLQSRTNSFQTHWPTIPGRMRQSVGQTWHRELTRYVDGNPSPPFPMRSSVRGGRVGLSVARL